MAIEEEAGGGEARRGEATLEPRGRREEVTREREREKEREKKLKRE